MNELIVRDRTDLSSNATRAPDTSSLELVANQAKNTWHRNCDPDLALLLRLNPELCSHRSLVIELAVEEYTILQREGRLGDIRQHFQSCIKFGGALYSSIIRQIEVERFLEEHPSIRLIDESIEWPEAGDKLGRYRIIEELGRGALARVFLCLQSDLGNRQVVVKVSSAGSVEGKTLGKLLHPNLMPIHSLDILTDSGQNCLCTPFLGRSTLHDLISIAFAKGIPRSANVIQESANIWKASTDRYSKGPECSCRWHRISYVDGVLYLARKLTDALIHSHAAGVIHGDLKPSNILLASTGDPVILDFNLARDKSCSEILQGGTLPYMPPEQLLRFGSDTKVERIPLDERSEIFSLGVVLFELMCGKLPFEIDITCSTEEIAEQLLDKHITGPPSLIEYNPHVGRGVASILQRCLAYLPEDRFASMSAFQVALSQESEFQGRVARGMQIHSHILLPFVTVSAIAISTACWWLFNRSPYYLREYEAGLAYASQGQYEEALSAFEEAAEAKPVFFPALFASARTNVVLENFDQAIEEFGELSDKYDHAPSKAEIGYCFNLRNQHTQAIPWYLRALKAGFVSGGLYNNLAISYARRRSGLIGNEQLNLIREHLEKAREYLPFSPTVRLNIVKHDLKRYFAQPSYIPVWGLQNVKLLLSEDIKNAEIYVYAAQLYSAVSKHEPSAIEDAIEVLLDGCKNNAGIDSASLEKMELLKPLLEHPRFTEIQLAAVEQDRSVRFKKIPSFIDPLTTEFDASISQH